MLLENNIRFEQATKAIAKKDLAQQKQGLHSSSRDDLVASYHNRNLDQSRIMGGKAGALD